jgi:hypothetical protein
MVSRQATQTASLFSGGVTAAPAWLQVLAPPEFEPVALNVVTPPAVEFPENSSFTWIAKFEQFDAPVNVAVNVEEVATGAMAPKIAPQLFKPVVAGGTI